MSPPAPTDSSEGETSFAHRSRALTWLLTDVDGVLTDGKMVYGPGGEETKRFHVRDGLALKIAKSCGISVGLLSARGNRAVEVRASELDLDRVFLGRRNKLETLETLIQEEGLAANQIAFIGDDLPDLAVLSRVGLALCPADAAAEVRQVAHRVLARGGGQGCVREAVEAILGARGQWQNAVASFR